MEGKISLSSLIKNVYDADSYTEAFIFLVEQLEKVNLEYENIKLEFDKLLGELVLNSKVSDTKMEYVLLTNPEAFKLKKSLIEFATLKKTLYYYIEMLEGKKQLLLKDK